MSETEERNIEGPWDFGDFTIVCSRLPQPELKASFWPVYQESFGPLRVLAAARQVLTEEEFTAELEDPRVWKYVALDKRGELAGLTTLTNDLSTMPWISPEYFEYRYPEQWKRGAVFYCGVSLVRPDMRRYPVFARMMTCLAQRVAALDGVFAVDMCGYNDQERSLARVSERILNRVANFEVRAVDVQTYYVARATGSGSREAS
ncbi:MAG: hypothetical protein QM582_05910 [Micropruina sp.]|uniref:hypothetical protein n=1 Tax=Micropruina sp. TaxID=2737536 RepID=UPI0039E66C45